MPFLTIVFFLLSIILSTSVWGSLSEILLRGLPLVYFFEFSMYLILEEITELLPFASLFAGVMLSSRLSRNFEFVAMRACAIPVSAIYRRYFIFGFVVAILTFFLNNTISPLMSREKKRLLYWISNYQGLSLIKEKTFNSSIEKSSVVAVYTDDRQGYKLQNIFIQQLNENRSKKQVVSLASNNEDITPSFGVQRFLFAKEGVIANLSPVEKSKQQVVSEPQNLDFRVRQRRQDSPNNAIFPSWQRQPTKPGYSQEYHDISFANETGKSQSFGSDQPFLRLYRGFSLLFDWDKKQVIVSDFDNGSFDYMLFSNQTSQNYISLKESSYTIFELRRFIQAAINGGNLISFYELQGAYVASRRSYYELNSNNIEITKEMLHSPGYFVELPKLSVLDELRQEQRLQEISQMSQEEIFRVYDWYLPPEFDTAIKRQYMFSEIKKLYRLDEHKLTSLQYSWYKRISQTIHILILVSISFPLGLSLTGTGKGIGAGMSIFVYFLYYIVSIIFEKLTFSTIISPYLGAWLPEILFLGYALYLYERHFGFVSKLYKLIKNADTSTWYYHT